MVVMVTADMVCRVVQFLDFHNHKEIFRQA